MSIKLEQLKEKASDVWQIGKSLNDLMVIIEQSYEQGYINAQKKYYDLGYADGLSKAKEVLKG